MKITSRWTGSMGFSAETGGHNVSMDAKAPIGGGKSLTPKELVVAGLCGCTGMDVVALLKKHKQPADSLSIEADVTPREGGHPAVFEEVRLRFDVKGAVEPATLLEAVRLSQTKFCGVSAMLSRAFPIFYEVRLNSELIGSGQAEFS